MQDLGAEVRELGGLAEREVRDHAWVAYDAGIGGEHAVDVGPDLNLGHAQAGTDDGRGIVGAAAPEGGRDAVAGSADVASDHRHEPGRELRRHFPLQRLGGLGGQGGRCRVMVVGDDRLARVDPRGINPGGLERTRHDAAAEELARRSDAVAGPRRGLAENRERRQHRAQLVNLLLDFRHDRRSAGKRHQRFDRCEVALPDLVHPTRNRRALAARGVGGHPQELIGNLRHGRDHDHRRRTGASGLSRHDRDQPADGVGIRHGCPAEFHHHVLHRCAVLSVH